MDISVPGPSHPPWVTSKLDASLPRSMPIAPEARRGLGLTDTMGSLTEPSTGPEDPDSDIPDEF